MQFYSGKQGSYGQGAGEPRDSWLLSRLVWWWLPWSLQGDDDDGSYASDADADGDAYASSEQLDIE